MKLNFTQIKICIVLILLAIIAGQGVWMYNMYMAYHTQFFATVQKSIETSILKDVSNRHERLGGTIAYSPLTTATDTSQNITKTIRSADTSFQVTYDRHDPQYEKKLIQFLLKDDLPIDVKNLDNIFRQELTANSFPLTETLVEYIDLRTNEIIDYSNKDIANKQVLISTEIIPIDIFSTIGIKAYAEVPGSSIIRKMAFQLILSILLLSICTFFLFVIIRTFFWREKMEQMRQDSVNAMTHEFKRPISSAVTQIALIPHYLEKVNTEKVQQYVAQSLLELEKLTKYTQYVQKLSNNNAENIPLNREYINLQDLFISLAEKYKAVKDKPVKLDLALQTKQTTIYADLVHFANIIDNLIENAIKYSNEKVHIEITVSDAQDRLKISVKDDGLGILDSDQPHIFGKFYRSNNREIQRRVGFGLGLTYVKALVDAHDGEIKVESKFGTGSEFILYFP